MYLFRCHRRSELVDKFNTEELEDLKKGNRAELTEIIAKPANVLWIEITVGWWFRAKSQHIVIVNVAIVVRSDL